MPAKYAGKLAAARKSPSITRRRPGLERGDFDLAMNGLEVLPEYQQHVLFTRPYYVYKLQLAVRKGERRFTTVEELKSQGLPVATLTGSAAERSLMRRGIVPIAGRDRRTAGMSFSARRRCRLRAGAVARLYSIMICHSWTVLPNSRLWCGRPACISPEGGTPAPYFAGGTPAPQDSSDQIVKRLIAFSPRCPRRGSRPSSWE